MYFMPNMYSYPYYASGITPTTDLSMLRYSQEDYHQAAESLLGAIKREASAMELHRELAHFAPNQEHKSEILHSIEKKQAHLMQFTNLYIQLTGSHPMYQIEKTPFQSYRDGLQKAYNKEVESYGEYHKNYLLHQQPQLQNVFLRALTDEHESATRFGYLNESMSSRATDFGKQPFVVNIEEATKQNNTFRTAIWTGTHLQLTLMSINVGEDIGLEIHPNLDQFLRVEQGQGMVLMGDRKEQLNFQQKVSDGYAIIIPAGKWHNLINTGKEPLKLYSIYAPPQHPFGTVHETKAIAMAAEEEHNH
ncbi:cupin domain-containing protein [Bacillus sp. 31A1R]|uniref:Cupin domain-containing protein n=1 Tax=Robertmurraya mangrovi TaxID=3098077 RepID=A0ABU5J0H8_9BACI|nr:cupin domain-containing protein [Bacillus sp. 31A1R]MDZ5472919.1 cupin domain-containing protein [Bacillus sp. 31A1R]